MVPDRRGALRARCADARIDRLCRSDCACEWTHTVELDTKPGAQDDTHLPEARPNVEGADRQRRRRAAGARDASVARAGRAIVAGRNDDEGVETGCACSGEGEWPVRERRKRLGNPDECDPRRVVGIAVAIRVDGALEPRQNLVGPSVHGPARGRVALPAGDPDRQHRRTGSNAGERSGPAGADEEPGHLRAVPLQLRRLVRLRGGECARVSADDVDPARDPAAEERLRTVDPGIEERDRDPPAVLVREADVRTCAELRAAQEARGQRRRIPGTDGVDARNVRRPLQQRDAARVKGRREAVDRPCVAELRLHDDALDAQTRNEELLRRERGLRPVPFVFAGRETAGVAHSVCHRR